MTAPVNETEKRQSAAKHMIGKLQHEAGIVPHEHWHWLNPLLLDAAAMIATLSISPQGGEDETTTSALRGELATGDRRVESAALLPCPFCGGDARWIPDELGRPNHEFDYIHCSSEECFGPRTTAIGESAIEQWNTRAPLPGSPVGTAPSNGGSLSQPSGPEAGKHEEGFLAGLEAAAKACEQHADQYDDRHDMQEHALWNECHECAGDIRALHPVAREGFEQEPKEAMK